MDFANRTFLVTGGASGLGAASAAALLKRGAKVVVADLSGEAPEGAVFVHTDVTDEAEVAAAVATAVAQPGTFVGLVNCAGIANPQKVLGKEGPHRQDQFLKALAVNLGGTFNAIRLAADARQHNQPNDGGERGVIVNTA